MSGRVRRNIKWDSSTEEEEEFHNTKYRPKLKHSLNSTHHSAMSKNEVSIEPRKRGRGPSKKPCLNRNALMARQNRQRKKAYMEQIENKLSVYQQENQTMVNTIKKQEIDIKRLTAEVTYLRSVLNNNTSITALLRTVNDGLRKINAQKKNNMRVSNGLRQINGTEAHPCYIASKENGTSCPSINTITSTSSKQSPEHKGLGNNVSPTCTGQGMRKDIGSKNFNMRKAKLPFVDSDHTYTISNNLVVNGFDNLESEETGSNLTSSLLSQLSNDNCAQMTKELDGLMQRGQENFPYAGLKKEGNTIDMDYQQLSLFDMDIFENLPKYDEIGNTEDGLQDINFFTEDEAFHSLDNTGICLHLNSDNVSLEFCSICHLNSKNSLMN